MTPFDLVTADEVFLVGTKAQVLAVGTVGGVKVVSGGVGLLTKKLYLEFGKVVQRPEEGTHAFEAESVSIQTRHFN